LIITSSLLGAELAIPLTLPDPPPDDGAADAELAALRKLAARISKAIAKEKAVELFERLLR
jgi:hypothetical protein